jgi:hypothetical protein
MVGIIYILVASPCLLPGGTGKKSAQSPTVPLDNQENILLGACLTAWSPAAGRSVKRSGLRDTGGIYLVSVHRAATGNVHRAVGQDFVLNVGDILYFTGLVEGFGEFCDEHGMVVLTSDLQQEQGKEGDEKLRENKSYDSEEAIASNFIKDQSTVPGQKKLLPVVEGEKESEEIPIEVGVTMQVS